MFWTTIYSHTSLFVILSKQYPFIANDQIN